MEVTLRDRKRIKTPLTIKTKPLGQAECLMTYETKPSDGKGEYWVVQRVFAKRNEYRIGKEAKRLAKGEELETSLANSSFTLADLGLEFLHWPDQKLSGNNGARADPAMCSRVLVLIPRGFAGAIVGGHQIGRNSCRRFLFRRRQSAKAVFSQGVD